MLHTLAISNYRSLHHLRLPLQQLNIITGANGSGKSNIYRALRLLAQTAQEGVVRALAYEGGLESALWAGPEQFSRAMLAGEAPVQGGSRKQPVSLGLGFAGDEFGYAIDLGLPIPSESAFACDAEIKRECIWQGGLLRPSSLLVDRHNAVIKMRDGKGQWQVVPRQLQAFDSLLSEFLDPRTAPETILLREQIRSWRFYDHFRSDREAPARRPQVATRTPVLSHDGADLAAALQTIREMGDEQALEAAVEDAFPGSFLLSEITEVVMQQRGLLRPLKAAEFSDGTLRYLCLIAALLTPRPPQLMVLNEPETSLHPDLLPALARLIAKASQQTQIIVVSHAARLVAALERETGSQSLTLEKHLSATRIIGIHDLELPPWQWPKR